MNDGNYYFSSYIKVLFGSFAGAGRVLNFYESSCVGPDTVVGVDVADAFHQVIQFVDTDLSCFIYQTSSS